MRTLMKMVGIFTGVASVLILLVFSSLNGQNVWMKSIMELESEISGQELESYVEAAVEIQYSQQETQRKMWQVVLDESLELQFYHEMDQAVREDRTDELTHIDDNEMVHYHRATEIIESLEFELVERLIHSIENSELRVDRFQRIRSHIEQDRFLGQKVAKMLLDKREADRQRVRQVNRMGVLEDTAAAHQAPIDELLGGQLPEPDYPEYIYHFVSRGSTLWELADRYCGNPSAWREILKHNTDLVIAPRQMRIGTFIRIPVDLLAQKPEPRLSVERKREIVREMFPLDRFRSQSFAYITQQLELRSELEVYSTEKEIRNQIAKYEQLRLKRQDPPDFLSLLIPELEPERVDEEYVDEDPVLVSENMIISDTRTPFGHDFYNRFYSMLDFPEQTGGFIVKVIERPIPGRGSQMIIEVNYEVVYQFRLPPDQESIIELANAAARGLRNYLVNFEKFSQEYF